MTAPSKTARAMAAEGDVDREWISSGTKIQNQFLPGAVSANRNRSTGLFPCRMMTFTADTSLALSSDHDLIRLTLGGQTDCFTTLMDRHVSAIRRCIGIMLHGNGAIDDVTQEVVLKAWRFLSAFRAESSFRTWITRVAINEVRQFQRREASLRSQELSHADALPSRDESPYEHFARTQKTDAVRAVVNSLPAKYREIVMLRELEELSLQEIAERLRCTIPAVKSRLFRGRSMLVARVRESGQQPPKRTTSHRGLGL